MSYAKILLDIRCREAPTGLSGTLERARHFPEYVQETANSR
jgi:hypothetical protein